MRFRGSLRIAALMLAVFGIVGAAAQTPAPNTAGTFASSAVENPTYVVIPMEITVDRPVDEVWKRIGGYCAITEWFPLPECRILSGAADDVGSVRSVGTEVMVAKTQYSYTYTQPVRAGRPYNLYHGTLEARPMSPGQTKLIYTLLFDNSMLADDAAREKDRESRRALFMRALNNMKILAEGGKVPPAAPR